MSTASEGYVDGPVVPKLLLVEYRAAADALQAIKHEIVQHDQKGKELMAQLLEATAVFNHFEKRIVTRLKLKNDDVIDLETGKVSIKVTGD